MILSPRQRFKCSKMHTSCYNISHVILELDRPQSGLRRWRQQSPYAVLLSLDVTRKLGRSAVDNARQCEDGGRGGVERSHQCSASLLSSWWIPPFGLASWLSTPAPCHLVIALRLKRSLAAAINAEPPLHCAMQMREGGVGGVSAAQGASSSGTGLNTTTNRMVRAKARRSWSLPTLLAPIVPVVEGLETDEEG